MSILSQRIGTRRLRKWFVVLIVTLTMFAGLESLAFLTGIYEIDSFLKVAFLLYVFLILMTSLIFDLKLKIPRTWERSRYYYQHSKRHFQKFLLILARALKLRFHYFHSWTHWRHFQNYLILPAILFWAVVLLIFLNPFDDVSKQIFIVCATLMFAITVWYLKVIFVSYAAAALQARYLMFAIMVLTGFLAYASLLGISWYFGLSSSFFVAAAGVVSFLLLYQSLFHHSLLDLRSNLRYVLLGALLLAGASFVVAQNWSVNYYTGGLLLAGALHWYWSLVLQWLQNRLTPARAFEYTLIFVSVVIFVLATTNFHARIG